MTQGKICIVLNPEAGHGKAKRLLPLVMKAFGSQGIVPHVLTSQRRRHPEELAREACRQEYKVVVAMGGDGTVGEVVNGILTSGIPGVAMGVIPAGTGNDFTAGNNLFDGWESATRALFKPRFGKVDVFLVQDSAGFSRYAVNSIGMGYDAYVVKRVAELGSRKIGHLSYMLEAFRGLFAFNPATLGIGVRDDSGGERACSGPVQDRENVWLFAITNSERFGGGMKVSPGANCWDGRLDYAYLAGIPRYALVRLIFLVRSGKHIGRPGVFRGQATQVSVQAPRGFPCHLDGDTVDAVYPVTVKVLPGALPLVVEGTNSSERRDSEVSA